MNISSLINGQIKYKIEFEADFLFALHALVINCSDQQIKDDFLQLGENDLLNLGDGQITVSICGIINHEEYNKGSIQF